MQTLVKTHENFLCEKKLSLHADMSKQTVYYEFRTKKARQSIAFSCQLRHLYQALTYNNI